MESSFTVLFLFHVCNQIYSFSEYWFASIYIFHITYFVCGSYVPYWFLFSCYYCFVLCFIRCEKINISGSFYRNKLKYLSFLRKRCNVNPKRGPFHHRAPAKIFQRTVRGEWHHRAFYLIVKIALKCTEVIIGELFSLMEEMSICTVSPCTWWCN